MKSELKVLCFCCLLVSLHSEAAGRYNAEIKGEYESWRSGIGGQSNALLYGAGLSYHQDKLFFGAGFVMGSYDMDSSTGEHLSRKDIDLIAGYQLNNTSSVFAGYRFNQINYTSISGATDFDENTNGLGAGLALNQVINAQWVGFGSAALSLLSTKTSYKDNSPSDSGTGFSLGVEAGTLYRINNESNVALRIKYQTSRINYNESGVDWPHSYVRFGLSLNKSF